MSEEKSSQCLPSQVTINIGTSGAKINEGEQPPAPAVDLTKYVTREAADSLYAPRTQVEALSSVATAAQAAADGAKALAGKALTKESADASYTPKTQTAAMGDSIRAARAVADEAKADAADAKKTADSAKVAADDALAKAAEKGISKADADAAYAPRALVEYTAEEARKAAAVAAEAKSKVLVIDPGFPVPGGIARGTLVVRPTKIMEMEHRQFAPVSAWPRFAGVTFEDDGLHVPGAIGFQPSLEQMLPSIGTWQINIYYTWKGNFDEPEEKTPVYNVRTWDEFGNGEVKQDEGQKIGELTLKPGDHVSTQLLVKPTTDPKATGLWAPRIQAPANGFVVHGVSVDYIENPD
jgi:hypothetical protein